MGRDAAPSVFELLRKDGLLLESDARLPSVVSLMIGRPIRGSWWGHPNGSAIYHVTTELNDRRDVAVAKLVSGKTTFVARRLWPHLLAVGRAREPWQLDGLSSAAHSLLRLVSTRGSLRTDDPIALDAVRPAKITAAALELERRLLVHSRQVHTETGRHAKVLEAWTRWASEHRVSRTLPPARAKAELERIVAGINARCEGDARLPWAGKQSRARSPL